MKKYSQIKIINRETLYNILLQYIFTLYCTIDVNLFLIITVLPNKYIYYIMT